MIVRNNTGLPIRYAKGALLKRAMRELALTPLGTDEILLDCYLKEHHKIGFRTMALILLSHMHFMEVDDNTLMIVFEDKDFEELWQLLAKGNLEVSGSDFIDKLFD